MRVLAPVMIAAALIIGSSSSASAFGLFGHHFGGCDSGCDAPVCEPVCGCEIAAPCGCDVDPCCPPKASLCDKLKGLFSKKHSHCDTGCCEPTCGLEPACGCEVAAPVCGCEPVCAPKKPCLLEKLFSKLHHKSSNCCEPVCEPACGFEPSCGCGF